MNCITPRVDFGNEVFHTNESIKLEEIATATSSRYSRDYRKLEPHIFVSKADVTIQEVVGIFKFLSPDEV